MRNKFLLIVLLLIGSAGVMAQNKTLGVGTASPNPNAALHVESPTGNQGMIVPRLTTAQRNTLTGILTAVDAGLMLFDTDTKALFIWTGTAWQSSGKLQYPSFDTVTTIPATGAALGIVYNNTTPGSFGVANFQNLNPNNGYSPLYVMTNSLTNGASDMVIGNPNNNNDVIGAITNGKGTAGKFAVNNASNRFAAVYATMNGQMGLPDSSAAVLGVTSTAFSAVTGKATGPNGSNGVTGLSSSSNAFSFAVLGSNTGSGSGGVFSINNGANTSNTLEATTNGTGGAAKFKVTNVASTKPALWAETNSNQALSTPIYGLNTGTGDAAGVFRISNASSAFEGVFAETNGTGAAILGNQLGLGRAGSFQILNASNTQISLRATTTGTGRAGHFQINNTSVVNNDAIFATTNSSGGNSSAIRGDHNGTSGYAGIFQNINGANTNAALFAEAVGAGPSIWANKDTGESGNSIEATHAGTTGSAGNFMITNASNTAAALNVETNSTGGFGIRSHTTGTEVAGYFETANAGANSSTLFAMTNSQGGHGIGAINTAEGSAFSIFQGGMKISTFEVTTGTTIATRAAAYRITGGGPSYTLSFPSDTGDMYMVYNDTAGAITFAGVSIPSGTGKIVVNFNSGSFRGL